MTTKRFEPYPCVINVVNASEAKPNGVDTWRYGANWVGYPDLWKHLGINPFEGAWAGTQLGANMNASATAGVIFALHSQVAVSLAMGRYLEEET